MAIGLGSLIAMLEEDQRDGVHPTRSIQVKLLKPDLALALTWWSVSFPSSKQTVLGNTTMDLQKFDDGWKIVASHTRAHIKLTFTNWKGSSNPVKRL